MFGLCISGRPVVTDFQQVELNKFVFEAADADTIHELAFFILPGNVLPDEYIACLYASVAPYDDWLLLGSVTQDSPSTISLVRWKKPVGTGSSARVSVCQSDTAQMFLKPISWFSRFSVWSIC
uniref:Hikeshi-like N-terminal domain-containing protein n=1 Tax=Rhodosorus marinus TaxID=101924 RepID=A0A7S2ZQM1_9RHOD|mmetsp:Transcript_28675/g.111931  ORF Transcript_28675/g.111931 Transcript_28675/m.111931 type:complete len:123 (+) Transcript_28675:106-474(+)